MYGFRKRKPTRLDIWTEWAVTKNLSSSHDSLAQDIRELKNTQLKAEEDRKTIIEELRKLNESLASLQK